MTAVRERERERECYMRLIRCAPRLTNEMHCQGAWRETISNHLRTGLPLSNDIKYGRQAAGMHNSNPFTCCFPRDLITAWLIGAASSCGMPAQIKDSWTWPISCSCSSYLAPPFCSFLSQFQSNCLFWFCLLYKVFAAGSIASQCWPASCLESNQQITSVYLGKIENWEPFLHAAQLSLNLAVQQNLRHNLMFLLIMKIENNIGEIHCKFYGVLHACSTIFRIL